MPRTYIVKSGDCMSKIATQFGFFAGTLWDHPDNSVLKELRQDPNVLLQGDRVFIPDKRPKDILCATGVRHVFRRKGIPVQFRLRLVRGEEPRAHLAYELSIDGSEIKGKTDADGVLECWISPAAQLAVLTLESGEAYEMALGTLAPVTVELGVRQRLVNLRFLSEKASLVALEGALRAFQEQAGLPVTGKADDATQAKLVQVHGS